MSLGVASLAVEGFSVCGAGVRLVPLFSAEEAFHLTLGLVLLSGYRVCLGFRLVGSGFSVCDLSGLSLDLLCSFSERLDGRIGHFHELGFHLLVCQRVDR